MSYGRAVGRAFSQADRLPSVGRGKSAVAAFVIGFMFGPFGLALYLKSWYDLFIPLVLIIGGAVVTAGVAAPLLWMLTGAWGAWRVVIANRDPINLFGDTHRAVPECPRDSVRESNGVPQQ